jgi:hypothetical protein
VEHLTELNGKGKKIPLVEKSFFVVKIPCCAENKCLYNKNMSVGIGGGGNVPIDGSYVNDVLVDPDNTTDDIQKKKATGDAQLGGQVLKVASPNGVITDGSGKVAGYSPTLTADPTFTTEDGNWAKVLQGFEQHNRMLIGNSSITDSQDGYNNMMKGLDASSNITPGTQNMATIGSLAAQVAILMTKNAYLQKSVEREMKAEMTQLQYQLGMDIAEKIREKGEMEFKQKMVEAFSCVVESGAGMISEHFGRKFAESNLTQKDNGVASVDTTNSDTPNTQDPTKPQKIPLTEQEKARVNMEAGMANEMGKALGGVVTKTVSAHLGLEISNTDAEIRGMETLNQLVGNIIQSVDSSMRSADQNMQAALQLFSQICNIQHDAIQNVIR